MSLLVPKTNIYIKGPTVGLPKKKYNNEEAVRWTGATSALQTRAQWIEHTTGVRERYWADASESTSDIAFTAADALLKLYPEERARIGQLILSTISGDYPSPPSSPWVQDRLGLQNIGAFDMGAACSGFVSALHVAASLAIATEQCQLMIAADIRSKFLDPTDMRTVAIFGDGASAILVGTEKSRADFRYIGSQLRADGSVADAVAVPAGGSKRPIRNDEDRKEHYIRMKDGPGLFLKAVEGMVDGAKVFLDSMKMTSGDVPWLVAHQGNLHLVREVAKGLGFAPEQAIETVQLYGNTSASSVGIALKHLKETGKLKAGDKILLCSAGGGGLAANGLIECQ